MAEEQNYSASEGGDPFAASLALAGAGRAEADAFLRDQRRHMREQFKRLKMGVFSDRLSVTLKFLTIIVGLAVAAGFGLLVWDAAHSGGLIIEPFSVPPDMAQRGLTGQVVAAQLLDRLAVLGASESSRATQSYANNWGDNIKVEIPETGVSVQELYRFLRQWLGHDIDITGEVYHTASGIAVTARAGDKGATFIGAETGLDALVQQAAEHVFETTQPYRYGNYLDRNYDPVGLQDRVARATVIYRKLIAGNDARERAWAWNGLGTIAANFHYDMRESAADYRKAIAATPDFTIGYFALGSRDLSLNRAESTIADYRVATRLLHRERVPDLDPGYLENARAFADAQLAMLTGDFQAGFAFAIAGAELPNSYSVLGRGNFKRIASQSLALRHDAGGMRAYMRQADYRPSPAVRLLENAALEDWKTMPALETSLRQAAARSSGDAHLIAAGNYGASRPQFAMALANLGDFAAAQAMIAPTAADCFDCLRARAGIAEMSGQRGRADYWFARALAEAPSSPFGYTDWGRALLARGDPDGAIAQFIIANQKGPHFADPLEGWGEALMAQKNPGAALAKFEEAGKYAPNWGRLHLKWGEALAGAGKPDEAKAQFARAGKLDLSPPEKSELERVGHG